MNRSEKLMLAWATQHLAGSDRGRRLLATLYHCLGPQLPMQGEINLQALDVLFLLYPDHQEEVEKASEEYLTVQELEIACGLD